MAIPNIDVNYWAVLLAAVINIVLGSLWYGPLFGKIWMKLTGVKMGGSKSKKASMTKTYILAFISSFVMMCILATLSGLVTAITVYDAICLSIVVWLGFVATIMLGNVIWEGESFKLYLINSVFYLVSFTIASIIFVLWR